MGFLDRFRPATGLESADAEARLQAVQRLPEADLALLAPLAKGDADPRVRRAASRRLRDPRLLAEVAAGDDDAAVREAASSTLLSLATVGQDEEIARAALEGLRETRALGAVARAASLESVARAALARLTDDRALAGVARHGEHAALRLEALERLQDAEEIATLAAKSADREVALAAVERLSDPQALQAVADRARVPAAARRARLLLKGHEEEDESTVAARAAADREAPLAIIAQAEALLQSEAYDEIPARLAVLQDTWIEEIPEVDDDLDERFREVILQARRRMVAFQEERAARERHERETEERLGSRRRLCEAVEGMRESDTAALAEARAAWETLPPLGEEEGAALETRFAAACALVLARRDEATRTAEAAAEKARRDQELKDAESTRRDNAARIERLVASGEKLAAAEKSALAKLEKLQREVKSLTQAMPPLPSQKEHDALVHRLKALLNDLGPKLQTLRETDRWQRWASAAVQEELSALMEDLARVAEEDGADGPAVSRAMRDLMERWRAAGPAPPDRSLSLWNRFRAARDRVRARGDVFDQQQAEEHGRNLLAKEALAARAEELSHTSDWAGTAEAIKGLQVEWKGIGPVSRGHEKAIWERFRKACDHFFTRRDQETAKRRDEWAKHLEAKNALVARAEALAASTDWKNAAAEIKKLQADWKTSGAVRRNQSEAVWNRFRAACDSFFERYKNRDAIERESHVQERAALCDEIEAFTAGAVAVADDAPADPAAVPAPTASAPPAEELVGRLRDALERWRRMRHLPAEQLAPLETRFFGAFDQILAAHPQAFSGTSLDAAANRRRMEEIVVRVEKLLPAGGDGADLSGLSPAARLAATWREALASNTMGARVGEDSRLKGAIEEVKRSQAAWQRLGYVPEPDRRALAERFDRACRRVLDKRPATPDPAMSFGGGRGSRPPARGAGRGPGRGSGPGRGAPPRRDQAPGRSSGAKS